MTYTNEHKVEYWSPTCKTDRSQPELREPRQIIVAPCYNRGYVPLSSGTQYREMTRDHVNVALLVPGRFRTLVTYRPDN
eukprot:6155141-Pyramimonas_sp.AAC.1